MSLVYLIIGLIAIMNTVYQSVDLDKHNAHVPRSTYLLPATPVPRALAQSIMTGQKLRQFFSHSNYRTAIKRWSHGIQAIINLMASLIFFYPGVIYLLYYLKDFLQEILTKKHNQKKLNYDNPFLRRSKSYSVRIRMQGPLYYSWLLGFLFKMCFLFKKMFPFQNVF